MSSIPLGAELSLVLSLGEAKAAPGTVRKHHRNRKGFGDPFPSFPPHLNNLPHIKSVFSWLLFPEKWHEVHRAATHPCKPSTLKAINKPNNPFSYLSPREVTPLISSQHQIKPSDTSTGRFWLPPFSRSSRTCSCPCPIPNLLLHTLQPHHPYL